MADEPSKEKGAKEGAKGGKKPFFVSCVGLVVVIGAAFLFSTFAVPVPPEKAEGGTSQEGLQGPAEAGDFMDGLEVFDVPLIMVNLRETNKKRILKVHLNLMYEAEDPVATADLFEKKSPEIKDILTTMLTEKSLADLESKEDLNRLRLELLDALNRVVFAKGGGEIKKLYYQEFIIQ